MNMIAAVAAVKSVAEVLCLLGSKGLKKQVPESDAFGNLLNIRVDYNISFGLICTGYINVAGSFHLKLIHSFFCFGN